MIDSNGNVKRAQIVQVLSQLKLQRSAGFESRATGSARSNRSIARQGITYFALPVQHRGLKPGIYLKRRFGHGVAVKPVFIFVPSLLYRPRLRFYDVGDRTNAGTRACALDERHAVSSGWHPVSPFDNKRVAAGPLAPAVQGFVMDLSAHPARGPSHSGCCTVPSK